MPALFHISPSLSEVLSDAKSSGPRILELDGLRGLAILLVVTKHYGVAHLPNETASPAVAFFNRFYPTLSGVDLFFVLTGFLLGGRLLAAVDSPRYYSTFYLRRCCRTFPPYYLLLLAFTVAVLARDALRSVAGLDLAWPFGTPWSLAACALFLQNFAIAATASLGPSWLMITWSLAVQEQFYLLLPWLLRCVPRRGLGHVLAGLFLMASLCRLAAASSPYPKRVDECSRAALPHGGRLVSRLRFLGLFRVPLGDANPVRARPYLSGRAVPGDRVDRRLCFAGSRRRHLAHGRAA